MIEIHPAFFFLLPMLGSALGGLGTAIGTGAAAGSTAAGLGSALGTAGSALGSLAAPTTAGIGGAAGAAGTGAAGAGAGAGASGLLGNIPWDQLIQGMQGMQGGGAQKSEDDPNPMPTKPPPQQLGGLSTLLDRRKRSIGL